MKEIEIDENHRLPFGYYYLKPIPEPITSIKSDEEIAEELAGSMPLSKIAEICDKRRMPKTDTEIKARIDVNWKNGDLYIDVYPSPFHGKHEALRFYWRIMPSQRPAKKFVSQFVSEKLNKIIYE